METTRTARSLLPHRLRSRRGGVHAGRRPPDRSVTSATAATANDDLAERLAADLDGCLEELVLAYQNRLYAFALRLTGSPPDAEEIAQDAFVRAYRALQTYPADRVRSLALRPWLYQITLNVARNRGRGRGRRLHLVPLDGEEDSAVEIASPDERPAAAVERVEQGNELAALVTALPPRYRAAVILRHVEGLSYRELATVLDQPIGTVKANTHRGIKLLRDALSEDAPTARRTSARTKG